MKLATSFASLAALGVLSACAVLPAGEGNPPAPQVRSPAEKEGWNSGPRFKQPVPDILPNEPRAPAAHAQALATHSAAKPDPLPDAIVKLDPGSGGFTREMEGLLSQIAEEAKKDERIILRLESYVPDGGSPALDIGIAEKALLKVKERLQALGVLPRRILLASFGGEHDVRRDSRRHWVEIYLLRPGY